MIKKHVICAKNIYIIYIYIYLFIGVKKLFTMHKLLANEAQKLIFAIMFLVILRVIFTWFASGLLCNTIEEIAKDYKII